MLNTGLRQAPQLSQRQTLSPQVIQYIKLLQKTSMELEQRIKEELEENPLLEEGPDQDEPVAAVEEPEPREEPEEEDWDYDDLLRDEELYGYKAKVDRGSADDDREIPTPYRETMSEHLADQLSLLELDDTEHAIAEQIVGSIDEDGYLRRPLESMVDDLSFSQGLEVEVDEVEAVLRIVQRLDPVGIAARDLRECLLVQLDALPPDTPGRDDAVDMLKHAYKAFTMKHFADLMRRLDLTPEALKEAFDLIQRLNPKPGEGEFSAAENYIVPDFTVVLVDDEFIITLNGSNSPQIRISRKYKDMLRKLSAEKKNGKEAGIDTETRQFLKNKFESARWFISSIQQRRHTMMKVMHAIVDLQEDFFRFGEGHLRPMILKDIAERIEMDISTVSRVVNGKYVQTEFGVYELKYFFSEGVATDFGEDVSNREIKALLEKIVDAEDKRKPLSDQKIANLLKEQGFHIARRTVSKYREQLGISVARLRKEIVME